MIPRRQKCMIPKALKDCWMKKTKTRTCISGYVGQEEIVKLHQMNPIICEKGDRNRPLTKEQKSDNRKKSKTRCLVEHVFGFEEQTMRGLVVRTVGLIRAKANVALTSLVYNISRYTQIIRLQPELLG